MEVGKIYRCINFGTIVKCISTKSVGKGYQNVTIQIMARGSIMLDYRVKLANNWNRPNYNLSTIGTIKYVKPIGFEEII